LREIHEVLLSRGRGAGKAPGEFRRTQNWIGGSRPGNARFVPPPPHRVAETMGALESFLHDRPERTSPLMKAGLAHVQFETIHPFLDGNGRVGRLLITLLLCAEDVLQQPLLYLSLFFKRHRSRYYELLDRVRVDGDWEAWIDFFAEGVAETAEGAVATARRLLDIAERDREKIRDRGRSAGSADVVHYALQRMPVCTVARLAKRTKLTLPTVLKALDVLEEIGVVREVTGKQRHRIYHYGGYMAVLNEGTEPL
jgi:Fic family protein